MSTLLSTAAITDAFYSQMRVKKTAPECLSSFDLQEFDPWSYSQEIAHRQQDSLVKALDSMRYIMPCR
jgi:hypothetical protein